MASNTAVKLPRPGTYAAIVVAIASENYTSTDDGAWYANTREKAAARRMIRNGLMVARTAPHAPCIPGEMFASLTPAAVAALGLTR